MSNMLQGSTIIGFITLLW